MVIGLVSVILPIYNVEKYLERCIKSIVNQSYPNLEIILVDDGSPDNCPQICDEWIKRDKRIKVIHKKNEGLAMARNTGIEHATGEYICFFDSDDYIVSNAIEEAYLGAKSTEADIVTFGYNNIDKNGINTGTVIPKTSKKVYEDLEVQDVFLPDMIAPNLTTGETTNLHMSAWASLYSMKLIKESEWKFVSEREIIAEDVYSLLVLYQHVKKVLVLSKALYCYCENETSLTHTYRRDRYEKIRYFHEKCLIKARELGYSTEIQSRLSEPYWSFTIAAMKMVVSSECSKKQKKNALREITSDSYLHSVLANRCSCHEPLARKILLLAIKHDMHKLCYILVNMKAKA